MLIGSPGPQHWMQLADYRDPEATLGALLNDLALALEVANRIAEQLWNSIF